MCSKINGRELQQFVGKSFEFVDMKLTNDDPKFIIIDLISRYTRYNNHIIRTDKIMRGDCDKNTLSFHYNHDNVDIKYHRRLTVHMGDYGIYIDYSVKSDGITRVDIVDEKTDIPIL